MRGMGCNPTWVREEVRKFAWTDKPVHTVLFIKAKLHNNDPYQKKRLETLFYNYIRLKFVIWKQNESEWRCDPHSPSPRVFLTNTIYTDELKHKELQQFNEELNKDAFVSERGSVQFATSTPLDYLSQLTTRKQPRRMRKKHKHETVLKLKPLTLALQPTPTPTTPKAAHNFMQYWGLHPQPPDFYTIFMHY